MSMDTIMEDSASFVSNTDAIMYRSSDISGRTESLISDPNIPNSSASSEDHHHGQQHMSTSAGCGATNDSINVSFCASYSRIFNVDIREFSGAAVCSAPNNDEEEEKGSQSSNKLKSCAGQLELGLGLNVGGPVSEEARDRPVDALMACDDAVQSGDMKEAETMDRRRTQGIGMNPQYVVQCSYYTDHTVQTSFYETGPYLRIAHSKASHAILEAFVNYNKVHVIDFSFNQGSQWQVLMRALASRPGGPPAFRLTGIGLSSPNNTDSLQKIGSNLSLMAEEIGLEFEFRGIMVNPLASDVDATILNIRPSNLEAVAVHSVFELHHLLSRPGPIEKLLNSVKAMKPEIVTIIEQEANHNGTVFMDWCNNNVSRTLHKYCCTRVGSLKHALLLEDLTYIRRHF